MSNFYQTWDNLTPAQREAYVDGLDEDGQRRLLAKLRARPTGANVGSAAHAAKMESQGAIPTDDVLRPKKGIFERATDLVKNPAQAAVGGAMRDMGELTSLVGKAAGYASGGPHQFAVKFAIDDNPLRGVTDVTDSVAEKGRGLYHEAVADSDTLAESLHTAAVGTVGEAFWDAVVLGGVGGVASGTMKALGKAKTPFGKALYKSLNNLNDFRPQGHLPADVFDRRVVGTSRTRNILHKATIEYDNLEKAVEAWATPKVLAVGEKSLVKSRTTPVKKSKEWMLNRVEKALHTRNGVEELPEGIKEFARPLRDRLDELSKEVVHGQLGDGSFIADRGLRSIVQSNFGEYMHESYKGFDVPQWKRYLRANKDKPGHEAARIWNGAREHIKARNPKWTDEQVEGKLQEIADFDKDSPFFSFNIDEPLPSGTTVTKKRKLTRHGDDQKIREFLGVYDDPKTNYLQSVAHTSTLLEHAKFIDEVVPALEAKGLASRLQPTAIPGQPTGNSVLLPGTGKNGIPAVYTTEEIAKSLNYTEDISKQAVYGMLNAMLKGNKTIWSAKTQSRNFISSALLTWAQGNVINPLSKRGREIYKNAWDVGRYGMGYDTASDKQIREIADLLMERGILNGNVDVGDFRYQAGRLSGWLEEGTMFPTLRAGLSDLSTKTGKGLKKTGDFPGRLYQFGDNFWKITTYQNEFLKAKSAYLKAGQSPEVAAAMAQDRALLLTQDIFQNYSRLSPAAKGLRDSPYVGAFTSFPMESFRNFEKTIEHGILEVRDPVLREIGLKRLMAFSTMVAGVPAALTGVGVWKSNVSYDQLEAARELLAEYDQHSNMMPINLEDGQLTMLNTSHFQYFNNITNPIQAAISGAYSDRPAHEVARDVVHEAFSGILSPDLATGQALEIAKRSDYLPLGENLGRAAYAMAPGILTTDTVPFLRAARIPGLKEYLPPDLRSGRTYKTDEELINFLGVRVIKINVGDVGEYKIGRARMRINRVKGILNDEKKLQRSPVKIRQAREKVQAAWDREGPDIIRQITAMKKLGVSEGAIRKNALQALKKEEVDALMRGEVPRVYD